MNRFQLQDLTARDKIWWSILPLTLAPLTGYIIGTTPDWWLYFALLTLISYVIISFLFPLRPVAYSMISTGLAAIVFVIVGSWISRFTPSLQDKFLAFLFCFIVLSLFTLIISHFRNKAIAKREVGS